MLKLRQRSSTYFRDAKLRWIDDKFAHVGGNFTRVIRYAPFCPGNNTFKRSDSIAGHVTDVLKGLLTIPGPCNRCVEGFAHNSRWLNNCDWEKKLHHFHTSNGFGLAHANDKMWNSHAIFFRCFVAKKGTETKLKRRLHVVFPRWPLPTIYLVLLTAYVSAAMGSYSSSIWFSSGRMRTYAYILAVWEEENHFTEDESSDFDSPERPRQIIRVSTKLAETIQKHRRRLAFNFFHADQQGTMFPCKHKSMEANHFKLVSRLMTSVEEDRLFYFSPGINGSNSDKTLKFVTSGLSSQNK
ncbi:hypothetical protein DY000_02008352 [Brassica cretica]|uniref:Uncharacterized protein n=1 Tax=Brassica cretica TaxID=69181 RepID=A0ABQ7CGR4_BRACR|nr:hypothetical protein DY000_02008352 [Brassica cretica]